MRAKSTYTEIRIATPLRGSQSTRTQPTTINETIITQRRRGEHCSSAYLASRRNNIAVKRSVVGCFFPKNPKTYGFRRTTNGRPYNAYAQFHSNDAFLYVWILIKQSLFFCRSGWINLRNSVYAFSSQGKGFPPRTVSRR